jgi:flagellar hook-basal body complex protein FliE
MDRIEMKMIFTFLTTIQFYDPNADETTTNDKATIGNKFKELLSTLIRKTDNKLKVVSHQSNPIKLNPPSN